MPRQKNNKNSSAFGLKMPLFLLIAVAIVSVCYIFNITSNSTNGFRISDLENKIETLKLANQDLKAKVNLLDNPALLKDKAEDAGLVIAGQVEYLSIKENDVAVNK